MENLNNHIWKPVIGYENLYLISNNGLVKNILKDRLMTIKQYKNNKFKIVEITKNGKSKSFHLAKLVAIHFLENPNQYKYVRFKDININNCNVSNLEWCSNSDFYYFMLDNGLRKERERFSNKLSRNDVVCIYNLYKNTNSTCEELSTKFKVDPSTIWSIINKCCYADVTADIVVHEKPIGGCDCPSLNGEEWKDIFDYLDIYQISNMGRIRSLDRFDSHGNYQKGSIKICCLNPFGYLQTQLTNCFKKRKNHKVHRLVLSAFVPNVNNLSQVNHKDGNKTNNLLENLEWANNSENQKHAYSLGLNKPNYGITNGNVKLTNDQVLFIRKEYLSSFNTSYKILAKKYNVHPDTIKKIIRRKLWPHI